MSCSNIAASKATTMCGCCLSILSLRRLSDIIDVIDLMGTELFSCLVFGLSYCHHQVRVEHAHHSSMVVLSDQRPAQLFSTLPTGAIQPTRTHTHTDVESHVGLLLALTHLLGPSLTHLNWARFAPNPNTDQHRTGGGGIPSSFNQCRCAQAPCKNW